jgi:hypothetical protein
MPCTGNYKIISVNHAREKEKPHIGKNKNPQSFPRSISLKAMFAKEKKTPELSIATNQNITSGDETLIMIPPIRSRKGGREKPEIIQPPLIPLN